MEASPRFPHSAIIIIILMMMMMMVMMMMMMVKKEDLDEVASADHKNEKRDDEGCGA